MFATSARTLYTPSGRTIELTLMIRPCTVALRPRAISTVTVTWQPCDFIRIVFVLLDGAFDVHRIQPEERQDRVAGLHPFILLALDFFHDAIEGRRDRATLNG